MGRPWSALIWCASSPVNSGWGSARDSSKRPSHSPPSVQWPKSAAPRCFSATFQKPRAGRGRANSPPQTSSFSDRSSACWLTRSRNPIRHGHGFRLRTPRRSGGRNRNWTESGPNSTASLNAPNSSAETCGPSLNSFLKSSVPQPNSRSQRFWTAKSWPLEPTAVSALPNSRNAWAARTSKTGFPSPHLSFSVASIFFISRADPCFRPHSGNAALC